MIVVLFMSDGEIKGKTNLPFDVNVAHFLTADANVIQEDVTGVPDDATQEEPESHNAAYHIQRFEKWKFSSHAVIDCVCTSLLCGV